MTDPEKTIVVGADALKVIRDGVEMSISFLDLRVGDRYTYDKTWYQVMEISGTEDGSAQILTEKVPEWNGKK